MAHQGLEYPHLAYFGALHAEEIFQDPVIDLPCACKIVPLAHQPLVCLTSPVRHRILSYWSS